MLAIRGILIPSSPVILFKTQQRHISPHSPSWFEPYNTMRASVYLSLSVPYNFQKLHDLPAARIKRKEISEGKSLKVFTRRK